MRVASWYLLVYVRGTSWYLLVYVRGTSLLVLSAPPGGCHRLVTSPTRGVLGGGIYHPEEYGTRTVVPYASPKTVCRCTDPAPAAPGVHAVRCAHRTVGVNITFGGLLGGGSVLYSGFEEHHLGGKSG